MIIYFSISNVAAQMCLSSDNPLLYPYNLYFFNVYLFTLEILFKNDCPPVSSFHFISQYKTQHENFPSSSVGKEPTCSAGDTDLIPGSERSPGEGNGNPLQYSCLENPWTEEPGRLQSMGSQRVRHD